MSFYNTQTLPIFTVKDPILSLTKNVLALQSGIVQPITSIVTSNSSVTYTAEQILNGSIIRYGTTSGVTDTWPSAAEIVSEMEKRLRAIKGQTVSVRIGDNVPLVIVNRTNDDLDFTGGFNVENDFNSIPSNQARLGQISVIGLNPPKLYVDDL
jgi:hypothetical protein